MPDWLPNPANQRWTDEEFGRYQDEILPEFYICPFVRGGGDIMELSGSKLVISPDPSRTRIYDVWDWRGRHESYHTWRSNGMTIRNMVPVNGLERLHHPLDPCGVDDFCDTIGRPKYSAFSWNKIRPSNPGRHGGA